MVSVLKKMTLIVLNLDSFSKEVVPFCSSVGKKKKKFARFGLE